MIEIDAREFRGDRQLLAKFLQDKLRVRTRVEGKVLRVGDSEQPEVKPNLQEVKDLVKRALHRMGMGEYHVLAQRGAVIIRERRFRELHERRRGSVPSPKQTVPYFFPG